jgi:hypothetical protein
MGEMKTKPEIDLGNEDVVNELRQVSLANFSDFLEFKRKMDYYRKFTSQAF